MYNDGSSRPVGAERPGDGEGGELVDSLYTCSVAVTEEKRGDALMYVIERARGEERMPIGHIEDRPRTLLQDRS